MSHGLVLPLAAFICVFIAVVFGFATLVNVSIAGNPYANFPFCGPDGNVHDFYDPQRYWAASAYLTVNLGFGGLSFAQPEVIDVAFDFVLGRGSQLLLTFWAYQILRRSFLYVLERRGISFRVLFSLFMNRISIRSLWELFRSTWSSTDRQPESFSKTATKGNSRFRFDWRLTSAFFIILHILMSPIILSAATSYQAESLVLVQLPNSDDIVPMSRFTPALAIIEDGDRIGLTEDYAVTSTELYKALSACKLYLHVLAGLGIPKLTCALQTTMP